MRLVRFIILLVIGFMTGSALADHNYREATWWIGVFTVDIIIFIHAQSKTENDE